MADQVPGLLTRSIPAMVIPRNASRARSRPMIPPSGYLPSGDSDTSGSSHARRTPAAAGHRRRWLCRGPRSGRPAPGARPGGRRELHRRDQPFAVQVRVAHRVPGRDQPADPAEPPVFVPERAAAGAAADLRGAGSVESEPAAGRTDFRCRQPGLRAGPPAAPVPARVQYRAPGSPIPGAGTVLLIRMSCNRDVVEADSTLRHTDCSATPDDVVPGPTPFIPALYQTVDVGLLGALGVEIRRFSVSVRGERSFRKLIEPGALPTSPLDNAKFWTASASIEYLIRVL